jgi:hypothetical protein
MQLSPAGCDPAARLNMAVQLSLAARLSMIAELNIAVELKGGPNDNGVAAVPEQVCSTTSTDAKRGAPE